MDLCKCGEGGRFSMMDLLEEWFIKAEAQIKKAEEKTEKFPDGEPVGEKNSFLKSLNCGLQYLHRQRSATTKT